MPSEMLCNQGRMLVLQDAVKQYVPASSSSGPFFHHAHLRQLSIEGLPTSAPTLKDLPEWLTRASSFA